MQMTCETMGSVVGGTVAAAALAFFAITYVPPAPPVDEGEQLSLNIPTTEQMCLALGAADPQSMMECQALEASAGEFVIAWMGLNGFILNGGIDIQQIQLIAELDDANAVDPALTFDPTIDPGLALDPSLDPALDPNFDPAADPLLDGLPALGGVTDPNTGETSPVFASPAQLALFCLTGAVDWLSLQDCISMNDRSTQLFSGVQ
jgi:hypothetical protein